MKWRGMIILLLSMTLLMFPQSSIRTLGPSESYTTRGWYSAANPCGGYSVVAKQEIETFLQHTVEYFKSRPLSEIFAPSKQDLSLEMDSLQVPEAPQPITMTWTTVAPNSPEEVPVIVVNYGTESYTQNSTGILWLENGEWRAQPYPQTDPKTAKERRSVLKGGFCKGAIIDARQEGNLLATSNDLGAGGKKSAQEVHLLKRDASGWHVIWVPEYEDWSILWMSRVRFADDGGLRSYTVYRYDINKEENRWTETWELKEDYYEQTAKLPYSGL